MYLQFRILMTDEVASSSPRTQVAVKHPHTSALHAHASPFFSRPHKLGDYALRTRNPFTKAVLTSLP
jgi:hypothetical protein